MLAILRPPLDHLPALLVEKPQAFQEVLLQIPITHLQNPLLRDKYKRKTPKPFSMRYAKTSESALNQIALAGYADLFGYAQT